VRGIHWIIGLVIIALMTIQAKPLGELTTSTALKSTAGNKLNAVTYDPQELDTAIELHQGGRDGGGSLW